MVDGLLTRRRDLALPMPRPPADPPELTLNAIADPFPAGMRKGLIDFGEARA